MRSVEKIAMRRRRLFGGAIAGMAIAGARVGSAAPSNSQRSSHPRAQRARVALVLGGGGCRGYGHIGFIKGLEEHGLKPNLIVGSSIGSVVVRSLLLECPLRVWSALGVVSALILCVTGCFRIWACLEVTG